jgi:hypothetical protein
MASKARQRGPVARRVEEIARGLRVKPLFDCQSLPERCGGLGELVRFAA